MPGQSLPQEILDSIVDCASEDISSLKSLALTSPRFLQRSRSHLYRTLRIVGRVSTTQRCILKYNPSLLKLVRNFSLEDFDISTPQSHALVSVGRQITLSLLIDELRDLEWLHIEPYTPLGWRYASPFCQLAIKKLLQHRLRYLSLVCLRDLPSHLVFAPLLSTVETWKIYDTTLQDVPKPLAVPEGMSLRAKRLMCRGYSLISVVHVLRASPLQQPALPNLVSLHLVMSSQSGKQQHISELLLQTSHNLKDLTLEYPPVILSDTYVTDVVKNCSTRTLPSIPSLQTLRLVAIAARAGQRNNCVPTKIPRLLHALLSINNQPGLERLEVSIGWAADIRFPVDVQPGPQEEGHTLLSSEDWGGLDKVLSDTSMYPKLTAVSLGPRLDFSAPNRWMTDADFQAATEMFGPLFEAQAIGCMELTSKRLSNFRVHNAATTRGV